MIDSSTPVFMDPRKIVDDMLRPLRKALSEIKTEKPIYAMRRQGEQVAAQLRHERRSEASKRAWVTIRARREAEGRKK